MRRAILVAAILAVTSSFGAIVYHVPTWSGATDELPALMDEKREKSRSQHEIDCLAAWADPFSPGPGWAYLTGMTQLKQTLVTTTPPGKGDWTKEQAFVDGADECVGLGAGVLFACLGTTTENLPTAPGGAEELQECAGISGADAACLDSAAQEVVAAGEAMDELALLTAASACLPIPRITGEELTSENSNDAYAKLGHKLTLDFDSLGPIRDPKVTFLLDGTAFENMPVDAEPRGDPPNDDDTLWTATATAPSGDGEITAQVSHHGNPDGHEPVGGVLLDNTPPAVDFEWTNAPEGFIDSSPIDPKIEYRLTITEANFDADGSTCDDGDTDDGCPTTLEDGETTISVPIDQGATGTFDIELDIVDLAGNAVQIEESMDYHPPGLTASLSSSNPIDGAYAGETHEITLKVKANEALSVPNADFMIGGQPYGGIVTETIVGVDEIDFTFVPDSEGPVDFSLTYVYDADSVQRTITSTTDGSSVTADFTAPTIYLFFPQMQADGKLGVPPTSDSEDIVVKATFPDDVDAASSVIDSESCPTDAACSTSAGLSWDDPPLHEEHGFITYAFEIDHFKEGTLDLDFTISDLAGNEATLTQSFDVVTIADRVSITVEREAGGDDEAANERTFLVGQDPVEFNVEANYEDFGGSGQKTWHSVSVHFAHAVANAGLEVQADDVVMLIVDENDHVVGLEVAAPANVDDPLEFSFSVAADQAGGFSTGDEIRIEFTAFATDFSQMGGMLARTDLIAEVDGPTIASHEYPADGDGNGIIDYVEFLDAGQEIVSRLANIVEVGKSEVASVSVGVGTGDDYIELGNEPVPSGDADIDVTLDPAKIDLLPSGTYTLVATAKDALGNEGDPVAVDLYLGLRQYVVVTPHEETVWVKPDGSSLVSFTLEPIDVAQNIHRFVMRDEDQEYALNRFIGAGAENGVIDGGLDFVRFSNPSNTQPLEVVDAQIFGRVDAGDGTESEFKLTMSDAFEIVTADSNGEFVPFSEPVFTAKVDDSPPSLSDVTLEEDLDDDGNIPADGNGVLTFTFTVSDSGSGLAEDAPIRVEVCNDGDCTDGPWTIVEGTVLDITDGAGTITVPRDTPGTFKYRVVAVDAVGNTAESAEFPVTVVGNEAADISLVVSQDGRELEGDAGVLYADMDSGTPGEDADSSDEIVLQATVLVDGQAEAGVDVDLSFSDVNLEATTDEVGQASWTIDPDGHGLDLATTTLEVTVLDQEIQRGDATIFISQSSTSLDVLWTGFYIDLSGPVEAGVGESFDVDATVYWLHEVATETGIVLDGADAAAYSGSIALLEDVGAQALTPEDTAGLAATDGLAAFTITRGEPPVPGVATDTQAGYRLYSANLEGPFPYGMEGSTQSGQHQTLVSGMRLRVDLEPMGMAGQDAEVLVDAEWLHSTKLDGTSEDRLLEPIQVAITGAFEADVDLDGATTVHGPYLVGTNTLLLSGTSSGAFEVFGASADMHGIEVEFPLIPDGMVAPGDDLTAAFQIVVDGEAVTPDYEGITHDLAIRHAGDASQARSYAGKALGDQDPFKVYLGGALQQATFAFTDGGINWHLTLPEPEAGSYELVTDLVVAQEAGSDLAATAAQAFDVSHRIYVIEATSTTHGGASPADVTDTYWFDRTNTDDVVHGFSVQRADWNGESADNHVPAADGTKVQAWQSLDGGATWQEHGAPIDITSGDGSATFTVSRADDAPMDARYRLAVVEDGGGAMAAPEGMGAATVPYEVHFLFTGISLDFSSTADEVAPLGQEILVELRATYDHDGTAVPFLDLQLHDDSTDPPREIVTDDDGWAIATYTSTEPKSVTGLYAAADGPHNLATTQSFPGALRWVRLSIAPLVVEKTTDGSTWEPVDGDDNVYTVAPGQFVRVTTTVVIDDGEATMPVDGGHLRFGSATPSRLDESGTASKAYYRGSPGTTGQVLLDVLGATRDGVAYGDADDVGHFTIQWSDAT